VTEESKDLLIEKASSAFRERNASGLILPSPSWFDLAPESRETLYKHQLESRRLERAFHPQGHSTTVQAVLQKLHGRVA
jgi:hypothetical protein